MATRIPVDISNVNSNVPPGGLHFFVETGSDDPPTVTLADNSMGSATFQMAVYAKGDSQNGKKGVKVDLWPFPRSTSHNPLTVVSGGLAVNIKQDRMTGPYTVSPA